MTRLARLQRAATVVAVIGAALGFATSVGCGVAPPGDPGWARLAHPLLLLLGAACGLATVLRAREIDRRRWRELEEPLLTSGEREYAHKEAERDRRLAGTSFLAAPLLLGYWAAYQLGGTADLVTGLLPLSPMAGFAAALLAARLWLPAEEPGGALGERR